MAGIPTSPDIPALRPSLLRGMVAAFEPAKGETDPSKADRWFREQVLPHEGMLRSWLLRNHPGLRAELDDIVQEAFFRILRTHALEPVRCPKTYLFGIARNIALVMHRQHKNVTFTPVNESPEKDTIPSMEDVVANVSRRQELALTAEAVNTLPDKCREVVRLYTLDGLSYKEIAVRLGLAEETVRVQMARAVKKCIAVMREKGWDRGL